MRPVVLDVRPALGALSVPASLPLDAERVRRTGPRIPQVVDVETTIREPV
ncbi:hypothetical protein ACEN85_15040 [Curtobacterium sp. CT11-45]